VQYIKIIYISPAALRRNRNESNPSLSAYVESNPLQIQTPASPLPTRGASI
jgi:hypothetical protein